MALRRVEFRFDSIRDPRVAGISLRGVRSGRNPESNDVTARLQAMGWSYLVDGREVVSGTLTEAYAFPPGSPRDVPLLVTFNLMDVFGDRRRDLVEVALALAGQRSSTHRVALRLDPTIETPVGRMRYPSPITLVLSKPPAR